MLDSIPPEKRKCHRCGFEKSCRELVLTGACGRWSKVAGSNPQNGEPIDVWACIDDHIPMLLLEIGNQTSKASIEVNQLRNEFKTSHDANIAMGAIAVQRARDAVKEATEEAVQPLIGAVRDSLHETARAVALSHEPQKLIGTN